MRASALSVSYQQLYGDSPMEVTLEQKRTIDGMTYTERGTFKVTPKDALILVAMLAPLARNVLPKPKTKDASTDRHLIHRAQSKRGLRDDHDAGEHRGDPIHGCPACIEDALEKREEAQHGKAQR